LGKVLAKVDHDEAEAILKKIKRWDDFAEVWAEHRDKVEAHKTEFNEILVPVEIIYPTDDAEGEAEFQDRILKINAARNNNAELTEETKANKRGHYDEIKENLDEVLKGQVEWKTNEGGRIKVRELVSLALIPISKLDGVKYPAAEKIANNPSVIFSSRLAHNSRINNLDNVAFHFRRHLRHIEQLVEKRHALTFRASTFRAAIRTDQRVLACPSSRYLRAPARRRAHDLGCITIQLSAVPSHLHSPSGCSPRATNLPWR
jgi:hypothetical protein